MSADRIVNRLLEADGDDLADEVNAMPETAAQMIYAAYGTRIGYSFHDSPRYSISRCVALRKAVPLVTMLLQQIEHLEEREDLLRKDKLEYLDTWIRLNA